MTDYLEVDFPNWALSYLVNADDSALTDEDKSEADRWLGEIHDAGYDTVGPHVTDDTNEFCAHPAFGLACDTTKVRFFRTRRPNGKQ